ncbi:hypothetical protein I302_100465 [Kwoniella bestiolae CBS 10118]|uniref:Uncharacterized protein n=1 Tax=Kwoniella bestiolae CBS 10118 TaxID=1296100 RepID=A0AAJ8M5F8_9TREE
MHQSHLTVNGAEDVDGEKDGKKNKHIYTMSLASLSRHSFHLDKVHDTSTTPTSSSPTTPRPKVEKPEETRTHKMKSRSFADLAEVFGFANNFARPSSRLQDVVSRPKSSASLERRSCE